MNTARLNRMAESIRTKAKPCPLCYQPVTGVWRFDYQGFTIMCSDTARCGCQLGRQRAQLSPTKIFDEVLEAWNRRD